MQRSMATTKHSKPTLPMALQNSSKNSSLIQTEFGWLKQPTESLVPSQSLDIQKQTLSFAGSSFTLTIVDSALERNFWKRRSNSVRNTSTERFFSGLQTNWQKPLTFTRSLASLEPKRKRTEFGERESQKKDMILYYRDNSFTLSSDYQRAARSKFYLTKIIVKDIHSI